MTSKAITREPDTHSGGDWHSRTEAAPSVVRSDDPVVARAIGLVGAVLVIVFGGAPLLLTLTGRVSPIGPGLASFSLALGVACLLFHAAFDSDVQFRRVYMAFGYVVVIVGAFLAVVPHPNKMGDQFGKAAPCLLLGLVFLLAFLRNETDAWMRRVAQNFIGAAGAIMAGVGLVGGNIKGEFLVPIGFLLALLGLIYLTAYVGSRGIGDDRSYRVGQIIGAVGALVFLVALVRSALPQQREYLVPSGILLMFLGFLYGLVSIGLCSDRPLVVLTRRELGAFFYSPIAYITLFACIIADSLAYIMFMNDVLDRQSPMYEPIVRNFILQWPTVLFTICIVPVITMRLMSEEKRTGTLEVLLTAPVGETSVALSKFFAAFLFFLATWVPFGLLLLALRIEGGKPFDYRPLLSFFVGLCFTGAGFVSMGLFFSSLTRNQIISGILTLVGMVALTLIFLFNMMLQRLKGPDTPWAAVLTHISYLDIWVDTTDGKLVPRLLLFYFSMTIAWLFLTIKVLEARRWT
jgi:ABC-type transport system involved in multi-copper enzyme maturation permease subunit